MNKRDPSEILNEHDPTIVATWIDRIWKGVEQAPEEFDWLHLAAWGKLLALPTRGTPDLRWAQVVIDIYAYVIEQANANERSRIAVAILEFKAALIGRLGNVKGNSLLDAEQLVAFFFTFVEISPLQARSEIVQWKAFRQLAKVQQEELLKQPLMKHTILENVRRLRRIKNMLKQLQYLVDRQLLEPPEELQEWLSLRTQLP